MLPLALAFAFQSQSPDVAEFVKAHRAADRALTAGHLDEAATGFVRCLEIDPKNANAAYGLACVDARRAKTSSALEWLTKAAAWEHGDAELASWDEDLANLRGEAAFDGLLDTLRAKKSIEKKPLRIWDDRAPPYVREVDIDRDATRIVYALSDGSLASCDARTGSKLARSAKLGDASWDLCISPDGNSVAFLTCDGVLHLCDAKTLEERAKLTALAPATGYDVDNPCGWAFGAEVEFDPSGKRVLAAARQRGGVLATAAGVEISRLDDLEGHFFAVQVGWNHDGSRIAYANDRKLLFRDGETGVVIGPPLDTPARVGSVAFSPDGKWIATGHVDGHVRVWNSADRSLAHEAEKIVDWLRDDFDASHVSFSPDSSRLAFTSTVGVYVRVLDVTTWKILGTSEYFGGRMGEPALVCWSPNGQRLWSSFAGGAIGVFAFELEPFRQSWLRSGRTPRASRADLAAFTCGHGVGVIEFASGNVLWERVPLAVDGDLFQTRQGYFDGSLDDLAHLSLYGRLANDQGIPLADIALRAFDPKRIRAARAGVELDFVGW